MNKKTSNILIIVALVLLSISAIKIFSNKQYNFMGGRVNNSTIKTTSSNNDVEALPIPPIIESDKIELTAQNGEVQFFNGEATKTRGYNGNILGPTLKFRSGEEYEMFLENQMEEETTIHWHGLLVDGDVDGVFQVIQPNDSLNQTLKINQEASTAWYHPHTMYKTASQVIEGLAGFIIIEDENSDQLNLPNEYGVNDIPIVFQRKGFTNDNQISLTKARDTSLVNGALYPTLNVKNEWVRLRIINGNNDELLDLGFSQNIDKYIIATDNSFIEAPLKTGDITLAPGERVELLLDLTNLSVNDKFQVTNNGVNVMDINIETEVKKDYNYDLPTELVERPEISTAGLTRRQFDLEMRHMNTTINGKTYQYDRVDEYIELGTQEVWTVTNDNNMMSTPHPFHIHGVTFQVIERRGGPIENWEVGNKDTILVYPGEEVDILVTYNNVGKFVYHCHFLNHEELGMMGTFVVE